MSSTGSSAATSDDKSSEDKNEDEEKEEKTASNIDDEAGKIKKVGRKWSANRFIDEDNFKVKAESHQNVTFVSKTTII